MKVGKIIETRRTNTFTGKDELIIEIELNGKPEFFGKADNFNDKLNLVREAKEWVENNGN